MTSPQGAEVSDFRGRGAEVLVDKGLAASREGRSVDALELFLRACSLDPGNSRALALAGGELLILQDYGRAETYLERAYVTDPSNIEAVRLLVRLWLEHLDRLDKAEHLLEQAGERHPDHPEVLKALAELRFFQRRYEDAAHLYERAVELSPGDGEALEGLASSYNEWAFELQEKGDADQAMFLLKRAMDLTPDWIGLHVNLGQVFLDLGKEQRALEEFELATSQDPGDPIAAFNMARLKARMGDPEAATWWYRRTLELDPEYPDARPELASLLYDRGLYAESKEVLQEELGRDPDCPVCHHNMGLTEMMLGDLGAARFHLTRSLELDRTYGPAHYNLAMVYALGGRVDDAVRELELAAESPDVELLQWLQEDRGYFDGIATSPRFLAFLANLQRKED